MVKHPGAGIAMPCPALAPFATFFAFLASAASAASAQEAVQVFGVIDTFVQATHTGRRVETAIDSSGLYGTRWGIKGREDLGGGVNVEFVLEQGFKSDTGAPADPARMFSRQSWVGIGGSAGQVRIGRQNALMFLNEGRLDAFVGASMGSGLNNFSTYTVRTDKTVSYFSPVLGPLRFQLYYGFGTGGGARSANGSYSGAVNYDAGPLHLALVHQAVRNALDTDTQKAWYAGGSYEFGKVTAYAVYHRAKAVAAQVDKDVVSLSARYFLTAATSVGAGYSWLRDNGSRRSDAAQLGTILVHQLSKRTQLYATLSWLDNRHIGNYTLNGAAVAGLPLAHPGADARGLQLGIVHFF